MYSKTYADLDEIIAELPAMAARERGKLDGTDGLYRLETEKRTLWLRMTDGVPEVLDTCGAKPIATIRAEEALLTGLVNGTVNVPKALLLGKLRLSGDVPRLLALAGRL